MTRLPRLIVALMVFLAVVFNLERITLRDVHIIDLKGFVYVLIVVVPLAVILFPFVRRQSVQRLLVVSAAVYLVGKFGIFRYWTVWDEYAIHLMIAELALLYIGLLLGLEIGREIDDFNAAVENIIFSGSERALTLEEATPHIDEEIARSRRYQRPLALLVAQPDADPLKVSLHSAVEEVQRSLTSRYFTVNLARAISERLRPSDMIIDSGIDDRLIILCPETSLDDLDELIGRLQEIARDTGVAINYGRAAFPGDAFTFTDLMNSAITNLKEQARKESETPDSGSNGAERSVSVTQAET